MRVWLKRLLWLSAIFLVVWLAVIVYWQSTSRLPSESDLLIYLGLLPLLLAGIGWGVYKAATHQPAAPSVSAGAPKDKADKLAAEAAQRNAEQERNWTLNIVATSLQTSAGNTAADVLGKLKDASLESELDPELKNAEGFAIFSARIVDLDVSDTQEAMAEWVKTSSNPDLQWSDIQMRSLHLAGLSIQELAPIASQHPDVLRHAQLKDEGRGYKDDAVLPLRLVLVWPKHWDAAHQSAASSWVKSLVLQHGWPEQRILLQETRSEHANPVALLDHITLTSGRAQLPTVGILLACESGIGQDYVDALASQGNLFGGKNTAGAKPGELAAGLLFADAKQSQLLGEGPFSSMHRASWAARDKSADERGKVTADLLSSLVVLALETSKVTLDKIKFVSSDNDHKPGREAELAEMLTAKLPDLDCAKDAVKIAQACGSTHYAATAAALCIAHQYVIDEQAPALCTSLQDPFLRAAVVLTVAGVKDDINLPVNASPKAA